MSRTGRLAIAGASALILLIAAAVAWFLIAGRDAGDRFAACSQGAVAGGLSQFGGPFTLTDQNGARVTADEVFREPALLYFGYTFCPDVCPIDNARNAAAADLITQSGHQVRPVFITVDPKRDTPQVLKDFAEVMHPDMVALTGTDGEIAAVNKLWRNFYQSHDDGSDPFYLVDHMTNTYLVLPQYGTVEFFPRNLSAEDVATRASCFLDAAA